MAAQDFKCYFICFSILATVMFMLYAIDIIDVSNTVDFANLKRAKVVGKHAIEKELEEEWSQVLKGEIKMVRTFHKGLAKKFEVIFESGHVASAKPILPETYFNTELYSSIDYYDLSDRQQKGLKRAEWEYQGWSEIVGHHVDKILGFYRKPPIIGRKISTKLLYKNDESWSGFLHRILPSYDVPMALVPWVDGLQRAIPDLNIRDYLIGNSTNTLTKHQRAEAGDASNKLVFDYLVDDHDTQGVQNWKGDMTGRLIHWDTGLGWRDGPYPRSTCFDILCGTKQWKGVEHHDPNPPTCDRICRFRNETVQNLRSFAQQTDPKMKMSYLLKKSLQSDTLFPLFQYALYRFYTYDNKGNRNGEVTAHLTPIDAYFKGMDIRIEKLLEHISDCEEKFGEKVYLYE